MSYKLRFVQKFSIRDSKAFFELEKKFEIFEKDIPNLPKTNRFIVLSGMHPTNTFIWECDFDSLDHLNQIHDYLNDNDIHDHLFKKQSAYIIESFTEIYKPYNT